MLFRQLLYYLVLFIKLYNILEEMSQQELLYTLDIFLILDRFLI